MRLRDGGSGWGCGLGYQTHLPLAGGLGHLRYGNLCWRILRFLIFNQRGVNKLLALAASLAKQAEMEPVGAAL